MQVRLGGEGAGGVVEQLTQSSPHLWGQLLTITTSIHGEVVVKRVHEVGGGGEMKIKTNVPPHMKHAPAEVLHTIWL